jgi:hypothetical protein
MRCEIFRRSVFLVFILLATCKLKAQGTVLAQNNLGATIFYLLGPGDTELRGSAYSVELHLFDPLIPGGVGPQVGAKVRVSPNGRFTMGVIQIPGVKPGEIATLILRWSKDSSGPIQYSTSYPFFTLPLGGDPDGDGPLLPITPRAMVWGFLNGAPFGFNDATDAPWIYAADTIDGDYRLVSPAMNNPLSSSLRFEAGGSHRFFRLVTPANESVITQIGPSPESPGLLQIGYQVF